MALGNGDCILLLGKKNRLYYEFPNNIPEKSGSFDINDFLSCKIRHLTGFFLRKEALSKVI